MAKNRKPEQPQTKLRIALIVDSSVSSKYVYDLATWGKRQSNLEISHLIIQKIPQEAQKNIFSKIGNVLKKHGLVKIIELVLYRIIYIVESKRLKNTQYKDHLSKFDLNEYVRDSISVQPIISKSGFVYRYEESDIDKIKKLKFHILIRCGSGILRGEILNAAKFGIISFHHADNRINRGVPAGFWEVYLKQDATGFIIQQLTEEVDGGNVLFRGQVTTKRTFLFNQAILYEKSNYYLKKFLFDVAKSFELPNHLDSHPYFNKLYKNPTLGVLVSYFIRLLIMTIDALINYKLLKKHYRWGVAFGFSDWKNLVMWRGIKIKHPPNHFLADPFVISDNGENYCFVEDYDYSTSRGHIAIYRLFDRGSRRIGKAMIEPFHMSYPYVFKYQSKYYMCPETSENKDIRLYECESFPKKWKLKKVIMSNLSAVDTTIFEKDNKWWLFTNINPSNAGDNTSELFIYYSDNPLTDNWIPHKKNPIFVDSKKARMGGILFDKNMIYRVSQYQGFENYGKFSYINKIIDLSAENYKEETLCKIEPNFFDNLYGTHHIHSNGEITVFDYLEKIKRKNI